MADIFDAFNAHPDREPCCPDCGDSDVKFATHDPSRYGFTLSVRCNECKARTDTANDGEHEALFLKWSRPKQGTIACGGFAAAQQTTKGD